MANHKGTRGTRKGKTKRVTINNNYQDLHQKGTMDKCFAEWLAKDRTQSITGINIIKNELEARADSNSSIPGRDDKGQVTNSSNNGISLLKWLQFYQSY